MVSCRLGAPLLGLVLLAAVTAAGVIPKETCVEGPDGSKACGEIARLTTLEDVEADTAGAGNTDRGERAIIGTRVCISTDAKETVCGPVIESAVAMDMEPSTRSGPLPAYVAPLQPKPAYPPPPPAAPYVPPPPPVVPPYVPAPPAVVPAGYKPVPAPPPASLPTYHPPPPPPPPVAPPPPPAVGVYPPPPSNYKPLIPPQTYPQTPLRQIRVDVLYRNEEDGSPVDGSQTDTKPAETTNRIDNTPTYTAPQPSSRDEGQTRVDPLTAILPTVNGLKVPIPVTLKCDLSAVEPLPGFTLPSGALPSVDLNAILAPFNPLAKPKPDTPPPKPPTPSPPYPAPARTGARSQEPHLFDLAANDMRNRQVSINMDHSGVAQQREVETKKANLRERLNARTAENERMLSEIGSGLYEKRQLEQELHELERLGSHSGGYSGQSSHATVTQGSGATINSQHLGTIDLNTQSARTASETGRSSASARFAPYGSYGEGSQMTTMVSSSGGSSMGMPGGMHMHRPYPMGMGGMMNPMMGGGMMYRNAEAEGQQVPAGANPAGASPTRANPPTGTPLAPPMETKNQKTTTASPKAGNTSAKAGNTSAKEDSSESGPLFKSMESSVERDNSAEEESLESSYERREKDRKEKEEREDKEEREREQERKRKKDEDDRQGKNEEGESNRPKKKPKKSRRTDESTPKPKSAGDEFFSWD